ncbi:Silenced mating-type M-specific polypeptide Mc [Colletotrichum shisoi]|uniref:Silenced mating-type M-specific polypeptide Mc n=1 Tax=Colletotrichum shisoi TaxID=2078593 RepID=A0A5Q4CC92_9PEZI|nr:Silenced mating-type M-specific polypeptide Mc [Colletotrichum shisoi]
MALNFNPGQIIVRNIDPTQVDPNVLRAVTEILDLHLNTFESTVAVSGWDYMAFGEEGRLFMALQMGRILRKPVMWVKDGIHTNVDRWVLGPCDRFIAGIHMIVSVDGIAVVVRRPPPQLLEEAPGALVPCVNAPERTPKITRPPNAFILYRSDFQAQLKQMNPHIQNHDISKRLGAAWNSESHEVRERYRALAKAYKERHNKMHPDYRYTPRKPSEKRRRKPQKRVTPVHPASRPGLETVS